MNYAASVADFFKSPKWMTNMLFGGLCMFIPILGPIVVLGWLVTGFWAREGETFETFPAFDFSHFDKYIERGLWPFLVPFVANLAMMPLFWMLMIPTMLIGGFSSASGRSTVGCLGAVAILFVMLIGATMIFAVMLVTVPLKVRASITQDFAKAFDVSFVKGFVALTWKEILLSMLFAMTTGALFFSLGMVVLCVGMYFATVPSYFSWTHLHKQLYALYLSRGGEPVPRNPKLNDTPPPLPIV